MKTWITVPTSALDNLDYSVLKISNASSAPRNLAGDTALIKWEGDMPAEVAAINDKSDPMNHEQALALLQTQAWLDSEVI